MAAPSSSESKPSGSRPLKDLSADVQEALKRLAHRKLDDIPEEDPTGEISTVKIEKLLEEV